MKVLGAVLTCLVLAAASAQGGSPLQQAPAKAANTRNPLEGNERARRAGAKLYARECASCHGPDGSGSGSAPSLNRDDVHQAAPGALFWVLRNGSLRRGMPSFGHMPDTQRWQIIVFLRGWGDAETGSPGSR
jgi:mono/diheme cytochrome c family protein